MEKITGGQALAQALRREGIKVVFGIPGAGQYEAVDGFYRETSIRYIATRHEQAASYMADGYARAGGEIAAVVVVPGPGLFNAASGMATARAASAPMLVVSGGPHHPGRESESMAWMRPLCKWVGKAERPGEIPALVRQALQRARTGRPQPVAVEIAPQVFATHEPVQEVEPEEDRQPAVNSLQITAAAQRLTEARRPVIWAGAGVHRAAAWTALRNLAEYLQAPVLSGRQGKGSLSDRHPLSLGLAEMRYEPLATWYADCDLTLAVGVSRDFADWDHPVIQIDVEESAPVSGVTSICADAGLALAALCRELATLNPSRTDRTDRAERVQAQVRELNRKRFAPVQQLQPQWDLLQAVRRTLPDDGILVQGMNQLGYYSRNYFPVYAPRGYLTSSSQITLGCAYPLALGAKIAAPERAVVALCGDGGFLYNAQELATAVQYRIPVVVVVFNDCAYGNVLCAQQQQYGGRVLGTRLHNPNFVDLARSFGVRGVHAEGAAALETALRQGLDADEPMLIEVPVGPLEREF